MSGYLANVETAIFVFPLLAAIFSVPYVIYQYRRYGSIPWWKTFLVFAFIFYLLCAYFMVILPLPADRDIYIASVQTPQLAPFLAFKEILAYTDLDPASPASWLAWLRNPMVYTVLFNFLLTMPFGAFLRYFLHRSWWQTLIAGFCLALFFELSQLTGLFGLYAHPYRLFDVDDLITNTAGVMLGFWLSIPLCLFLPDLDDVNELAITRGMQRTSFTRRLVAFILDLVAMAIAARLLALLLPGAFFGAAGALALQMLASGIAFMLIPAFTRGRTMGHLVLQLRVVRPDASAAPWYACVARYALLFWGFLFMPRWIAVLLPAQATGELAAAGGYELFVAAVHALVMLVQLVWLASVLVRAVLSAFKHPFVMLNGLMTNTRVYSLEQIDRMRAEEHMVSQDEEVDPDLGSDLDDAFDSSFEG